MGCAKHAKKPHAKKDDGGKDTVTLKSLAAGPGYSTVYQSAADGSPTSFTLAWTRADLHAGDGTVDTGRLTEPHGRIFQDGKPSSTYRSDTGDAVRATKRLNMRDHVLVRSLDGTQTLTSDQGEYRGDVKIVRAIGNVVAKTPSGTLSGAPELWATPDLKLIGTPDMVAKTLKIPALVALAATAATGKPVFQGQAFKLENVKPYSFRRIGTGSLVEFTFVPVEGKSLLLTLPSRNMTIQSAGTVVLLLDSKTKETRHMTSQGKAHVVQTSDAGTTTMDGDGSVYDAPAGSETGTLDVGGRVTLTSETRRKDPKGDATPQNTVSKGDKGRALLLAKPPKDGDALKEAVLTGDVTIDSKGASGGTFNGTGDRMVYTPHGATADVDLTGSSVVLTSTKVGKDEGGKATTQTTVGRGRVAHAVIDPKTGADADPLHDATLTGGVVSLDVSGSDGQDWKSTGDRLVYTATGGGNGRAVMTGDLKIAGDNADYLGDIADADMVTVGIDKSGWQKVAFGKAGGGGITTTVTTKHPPEPRGTKTSPGGKKKKGGRG